MSTGEQIFETLKEKIIEQNSLLNELSERFLHSEFVKECYNRKYPVSSARFTGKGVIYTVITGGYDIVSEPTVDCDYDYVLLTDKAPEEYSGKWNVQIIENKENLSAARLSRLPKILPYEFFPDYDFSIYVDGALTIKGDFKSYVDTFRKQSGMLCFPHHIHKNIIDEATGIIENGKATKEELFQQIESYTQQGYTGKGYIAEAGCLVRDHHDETLKKVMNDWWNELCSYSHNRDQMSFDYACWKNGYDYDICNYPIYNNPWIVADKH